MNPIDYHAHYNFVDAVLQNNFDYVLSRINIENFCSKNPFSWTPLHYAVALDNLKLAEILLKINLRDYIDCEDKYQRTPISIAARRGNLKMLCLLLSNYPNLQIGLPLCHAAISGSVDCVLILIENGCNMNDVDFGFDVKSKWYKPLLIAIHQNHPRIVQLLIDYGAYTGLDSHTINMTPLHYACQTGTLEVVKALVRRETCLDRRSRYDNTPLDLALLNEKCDIVKYLLQAGASVNNVGKAGQNALHTAVISQSVTNVDEILKYMPEINRRDSEGRTPFYLCCYHCRTDEIFDVLINSNADVNIGCYKSWTPLHLCCATADFRRVTIILQRISKEGVNAVTMNNITPLYLAVCTGDFRICRDLLKKDAYINIPINKYKDLCSFYPFHIPQDDIVVGYTSEIIAVKKRKFYILDLLNHHRETYPHTNLQHLRMVEFARAKELDEASFAALDLGEIDLLGWTCLHYAAEFGHYKLAKFCIDRFTNINIPDYYGRTPLTLAAANGNLEMLKLLIENGANSQLGSAIFYLIDQDHPACLIYLLNESNIQVVDGMKRTPVMYAVIKNNSFLLNVLLQESMNIEQKDECNETALHHASYGSQQVAQAVTQKCADVNAQNCCGETPLHIATIIKNHEVMEYLLMNGANPDIGDDYMKTPLHYAVYTNNTTSVEIILKYSANVNTVDCDKHTPLHYSLYYNTTDIFKLLLRHGAHINKTLRGGWSVWHICAHYGNVNVAKELYNHSTDINALSEDGVSPLCIASAEGHRDFVEMLILMGAIIDAPTMGLSSWREQPTIAWTVPTIDRTTPLSAAVNRGHEEIAKLLRSTKTSRSVHMGEPYNFSRLGMRNYATLFVTVLCHSKTKT